MLSEDQAGLIEAQKLLESNNLTATQFQSFLEEIEKIPSSKSMIDGKGVRLCFEVMEDTGARTNETIHIRKKDVDFRTNIITIVQPKSSKLCKCATWSYHDGHTRSKVIEKTDPLCKICHGLGRFKKPQRATFTKRIYDKLRDYCNSLHNDDDLLFPVSRQSIWKWAKRAGVNAKINIFQQKDEKLIEGVFPHLFRAMCALRVIRDSQGNPYKDQLVIIKLRHHIPIVTMKYTRIDINYLLAWEKETYSFIPK